MAVGRAVFFHFLILGCSLAFMVGACAPLDNKALVSEAVDDESFTPAMEELVDEPVSLVPESEQTVAQEIKDLQRLGKWERGLPADDIAEAEVNYDFPVTINRQVQYYLDFFQNENKEIFRRWLARSGRYVPLIQEQLREAGLPLDLAYLAMIESGYNERAYSSARAVGLWQFIKGTGRHYGLKINDYVDERRDPIKSTRAAVAYLSDLYEEFGSWYLAVAGYNAGEGRIRGAIRKYKTTDFWELAQGRYLRLETKRYVPKLIAALIIAKDPGKYGFADIAYEEPFAFEIVEVPRWTALRAVALASGLAEETLSVYNRELRKPFTPPEDASYQLRVPVGLAGRTVANLPRVHAYVATNYKTHRVKKGETIGSICKKYGLTKTIILKANLLHASDLQAGQRLRIPFRTTSYELLPAGSKTSGYLATETTGGDFILHKIRPGETVSELAIRYNVPSQLIAAWNDLQDISRIRAGQQLALYVRDAGIAPKPAESRDKVAEVPGGAFAAEKNEPGPAMSSGGGPGQDRAAVAKTGPAGEQATEQTYYRVQNGDSLWLIARRHQVSAADIRRWNNLTGNTIYPGNRLVMMLKPQAVTQDTYYQVRNGDSLWLIARRHNLSTENIKRWNNLKNDVIHPGSRLLLKLGKDV